jgi:twitching motility protein PilT
MERGESEGRSLTDAMDQGELEGMQTFDGVIERMIREGVVNKEEALHYASNSGNLQLRLADYGGAPVGGAPAPSGFNGRPAAPAQSGSMLDMLE